MTGKQVARDAAQAAAEGASCVAMRARRLARLVTRIFEEELRGQVVTVAQFTLLGATILEGPLSPARLTELLDLEKSTLSRNLRLLESQGLIRMEPSARGTGRLIGVTPRGERALLDAMPAWRSAQARAVAALGQVVVGRMDSMIADLSSRRPARAARSSDSAPAGPRARRQRGSP